MYIDNYLIICLLSFSFFFLRYDGMKPNNPEHISILSEITGIPRNNLWSE